MKLVSANIGSLNTNQVWKSWQADIVCLKETRVGKTNVRTASKSIEALGRRPVFGELLPGLWHQNGTTKTPCGGTAILGSSVAIQPFEPAHDVLSCTKVCSLRNEWWLLGARSRPR